MKSIVRLGNLAVPRGYSEPTGVLVKEAMRRMKDVEHYRSNVSSFWPSTQSTYQRHLGEAVDKLLVPYYKSFPPETRFDEDISFLAFKSVDEHDDDWHKVKVKGQWYATAFLHWVWKGKFTLHAGGHKEVFQKGDVFAMNPNVKHFVKTPLTCLTACKTIRAVDSEMFRIPSDLKGVDHENVRRSCCHHRGLDVPRGVHRPRILD